LVVITIVAVIAGVVITQFDSVSHDQLLGTAQVVAADIAHARNLAVTNNSSYKITFDRGNNGYTLAHSGANIALNSLPISPFHSASGSTTQQITDLGSLPIGSGGVNLAVVESNDSMMVSFPTQVFDVEFGPLGETKRATRTTIWLAANAQRGRRFIGIDVDPITGLASIGTIQTAVPQSLMMEEMNSYASDSADSTKTGSKSSYPATATTF